MQLVANTLDVAAKQSTFAWHRFVHPVNVCLLATRVDPQMPNSCRRHYERRQSTGCHVDLDVVHERQVAAEMLVASNPLVVVDEVATAVQNQLPFKNFYSWQCCRSTNNNESELIDWVKVLRPTQHKTGRKRSPSQSLGLVWKNKTQHNKSTHSPIKTNVLQHKINTKK